MYVVRYLILFITAIVVCPYTVDTFKYKTVFALYFYSDNLVLAGCANKVNIRYKVQFIDNFFGQIKVAGLRSNQNGQFFRLSCNQYHDQSKRALTTLSIHGYATAFVYQLTMPIIKTNFHSLLLNFLLYIF